VIVIVQGFSSIRVCRLALNAISNSGVTPMYVYMSFARAHFLFVALPFACDEVV
jgi:hypothetical protein